MAAASCSGVSLGQAAVAAAAGKTENDSKQGYKERGSRPRQLCESICEQLPRMDGWLAVEDDIDNSHALSAFLLSCRRRYRQDCNVMGYVLH